MLLLGVVGTTKHQLDLGTTPDEKVLLLVTAAVLAVVLILVGWWR